MRVSDSSIQTRRAHRIRWQTWATVVSLVVLATAGCIQQRAPLAPASGPWRFSGTITSISGARIAGARLTILDGPNVNVQATSDGSGRYVFEGLESGSFSVLIERSGFASVTPLVDLFRDIDVNFALAERP